MKKKLNQTKQLYAEWHARRVSVPHEANKKGRGKSIPHHATQKKGRRNKDPTSLASQRASPNDDEVIKRTYNPHSHNGPGQPATTSVRQKTQLGRQTPEK